MDSKIGQATGGVAPTNKRSGKTERSLTALHVFVIAICALGLAVDLSEIALGSVLASFFSSAHNKLGATALSWLVSAVYIGAIVGAPLGGALASRFGSRAVLAALMLWLTATSLAAASATGVDGLVAARLLSGLSLGAFPPLAVAYLIEAIPPLSRGKAILTMSGIAYLGPPITIFTTRWLTGSTALGIEGWRLPFVAAALLSGFAAAGFWWLSRLPAARSHRTAEGQQASNQKAAGQSSLGLIVRKPHLKRFGLGGLVMFVMPYANVAFPLVTGPILLQRGVNLSDTLLYIGLGSLGPVAVTFAGGFVVDRTPKTAALASGPAAMLAAIATFMISNDPRIAAASVIAFGVASALYQPILLMAVTELFPHDLREAGSSAIWTVNRVGAATAPILLLQLVAGGSPAMAGLLIGAALLIGIFAAPRIASNQYELQEP